VLFEDPCECFSGESLVTLATGKTLPMRLLRVGDVVQVVDPVTLRVAYEPVLFFQHVERIALGEFVRARMGDGRELLTTPHHVVFVSRDSLAAQDVQMRDVRVGDALFSVGEHEATPSARVVAVDVVRRVGIFCPQTATGTIVVDGVLASCYALRAHYAKHAAMMPMLLVARAVRRVLGPARDLPEDGLHPYLHVAAAARRFVGKSAADGALAVGAAVVRAAAGSVAAGA